MWAPAPEPGSHASSYADATGAGANYVYLVDAADDRDNVRELQLIFFGWGSALRSIADRVLPNPEIAMWAPAPAAARGALDR